MFDQHYTGEEKVIRERTEVMVLGADVKWHKRLLDSLYTIEDADDAESYHVECQCAEEKRLPERYDEYDGAAARNHAYTDKDGGLVFPFPESGVLYLRPPAGVKEYLEYSVQWDEETHVRWIRVLCPDDYSVPELLEEDHLIMLPFFLFRYSDRLLKMSAEEKNQVLDELEELRDGLQELVRSEKITVYEERTLRAVCLSVSEHVATDDDIRKEVPRIMGGQVLDYEAKRIHDAGKAEGADQKVRDLVQKMLERKYPADEIASIVGWSEEDVLALS